MEPIDLGTGNLRATKLDRVLRVVIDNRARRNAIKQEMYRGLKRAAILADDDPELDALCLTGVDDVFAVGGDMSGQDAGAPGLAEELDPTEHFPFRHLERCRKVVVAAVNGLCHAGGLNLVLFSDLCLASERATFRAPELLRGIPDPWMAARLAEFVGLARARWLLFTGESIDAREAERIGLVGKVVPHDAFAGELERTLAAIRRTGPQARAMVKEDLNRRLPVPDVGLFRRSILSPEMVEGFASFFERREPRWPRG